MQSLAFSAIITLGLFAPLAALAETSPASALSEWALQLSPTLPASSVNDELRAAHDAAALAPARLVTRLDGLEVWAREMKDGSQLVGLFNRDGRKPVLDESKAAYTSPLVTQKTPGNGVDIDVDLKGSRKLYLVANNGGDGDSGDHADWVEPRLTGPQGEIKLTDLQWRSASTGWGSIGLGKSAGGGELQLGDVKAADGIGTHADSVIEYDLPAGCTRFKARAGIDRTGTPSGSVKFSVYTATPWKKPVGPETVSVALRDLGFAGACTVRQLSTPRDLGTVADTLTAAIPRRGAELFRLVAQKPALRTSIRPGEVWGDTEGRVIQAHGGGILFHEGFYYWYGENKNGPTKVAPVARVDVSGVSCYSSRDLLNWKNEGLVLKAVDEPDHDLRPAMVLERPKVIYNAKTKKFVLWAHIDSPDYRYARGGVAVSDSPTGPFTYLGSVRPEGAMCRDMTLFVDDDGTAYHIYASEDNATTYISKLSDDYTKHTGDFVKAFEKKHLEAPAVFKHAGKYYMIASGQSGWNPNPAHACVADSIRGPWTELGNPCRGEKAKTTYDSQSTHVLPIQGLKDAYLFMGDRWNPPNLRDSRYVWLPIKFEAGKPVIDWLEEWTLPAR